MFQFSGFASYFRIMRSLQLRGLPHSDISGYTVVCTSPELFAAYHVLLRLREPQAFPVRPFLLSLRLLLVIIQFRCETYCLPIVSMCVILYYYRNVKTFFYFFFYN